MKETMQNDFLSALGINQGEGETIEIKTEEEAKALEAQGIIYTKYQYDDVNYGFYIKNTDVSYSDDELETMMKIKMMKDMTIIKYCAIACAAVIAISFIASIISIVNMVGVVNSLKALF